MQICDQKIILSVSQINEYIRQILERDELLLDVFVKGEISNFTYQKSGHMYFSMKDTNGQIKCVMFRSSAMRLKFLPKDGMSVIVHGHISSYVPSGQYQLYVDDMQPDGIGSLAMQFEQIKQKLQAEGLFDESRKKPIPKFPKTIGVVTSPTGAAIHDILNITKRRYPIANILLFPAQVQGESAPEELTLGVQYLDASGLCDVIILGRGGGSAEDLWAFNNEGLARAVAACKTPIISAVGHEVDFTICDFVADLRAPTPSAAAELAVPDVLKLKEQLQKIGSKMQTQMTYKIQMGKEQLNIFQASRVFKNPERMLEGYNLHISDLNQKLEDSMKEILQMQKHKMEVLVSKLNILSPLSALTRGYTITEKDGHVLNKASDVKEGDIVTLRFTDGTRDAKII